MVWCSSTPRGNSLFAATMHRVNVAMRRSSAIGVLLRVRLVGVRPRARNAPLYYLAPSRRSCLADGILSFWLNPCGTANPAPRRTVREAARVLRPHPQSEFAPAHRRMVVQGVKMLLTIKNAHEFAS